MTSAEDIVSAAKAYVAAQGYPSVEWQPQRRTLVVPTGAVTQFVDLSAAMERWGGLDSSSRRRLLDRTLLALRKQPDTLSDELLSERLLPRLRPLSHFSSLQLHRRVVERVEGEPAPELTLPHRGLTDELGVHLVFELSEESADINDARLSGWGRSFDELMELALSHLRRRTEPTLESFKPGLFAWSHGDGHDAARLLLEEPLLDLRVSGELVVMAPHFELLLATGTEDPDALLEMAKLGLQASQQPFGLPGTALRWNGARWTSWLPAASHPAYDALRMARLPAVSRAYGRQKELLEAWFELEQSAVQVAPMIILEEAEERLFSGAVWLRGVESLIPEAERIAFAIPDEGDNARIFPLKWDEAVHLSGIKLEQEPGLFPRRYRASGFPNVRELELAARRR